MEGTPVNEGFPAQPGAAPTDEVVDEPPADEVSTVDEPPAADGGTDDKTLTDESQPEQEAKPKPKRKRAKKADADK